MAEHARQTRPARPPGTLVAVVGPSGAGKDSLIQFAMAHFSGQPEVHLVQRVITRAADAGGEDHVAVSAADFEARQQAGDFAVHWDAHGLRYGIPASVLDQLSEGHVVVANGSRSVLDRFQRAFASLLVVNVTARPEVLAARLQARGRESAADIEARLTRGGSLSIPAQYNCLTIDNSGPLEEGGRKLVAALEGLLAARPAQQS
ncbi:phosphonate metabolism protein/1,5-bisphosphokinase (PRPP-forming) PhnN [Rhizobium sp. SL42]|uniref:phosphonate metabolism protein/1,5-bisphosphokinase (PRPP-forming) PhnN n=1 Tax=Rhizobium sp. SL42 TaxID=2806346 RepID=UPI001F013187|nr:phosphonate metabolism protein/1,5-bisphosphokinase (PRPP-forming) PhnN [Rhizobium sp. SL42]UJW75595.1 phosphonate metabolism protein/1,5-bisphosphokinase (PRPP-forming) PhnN [Rhizobium sp. SL42]